MRIYDSTYQNYSVELVGGKGLNLFRLRNLNIRVPDFAVIDPNVLKDLIPEELKEQNDTASIKKFIDELDLSDQIDLRLKEIFPAGGTFAVRSSAVQEDGEAHSFAGQFETHLYVDFQDIPKFIKEIWKSNFSERVDTYLKVNKLERQYGIAVVIQEMIDPDVSGVAFGINPNTNKADSKVICSVFGVGEGLVSGALNADTYTIDGTTIDKNIIVKDKAARRSESGYISLQDVPAEKQSNSSLDDRHIHEIIGILDRLEEELSGPQDIEFAVKGNQLYLLQTRPVTTVSMKVEPQQKEENRIVWDNSNIIESYPGVTTPLTFSYILDAYRDVYILLAELMGASKKMIQENKGVFENMLGLINGRVYYNLFSWYRVLALFPGYQLNARFMENMMGVKERFDLPKSQRKSSKIAAFYRTMVMVSRIIYNRIRIKKLTREFYADVDEMLEEFKSWDLDDLTAFELKEKWEHIDRTLTPKWKAPMVNDSFAMIYFGQLQKLIEKYQISDNPNLQNDLLCGSKDIISVEPIHRSISLATQIGADSKTKELFVSNEPSDIWNKIDTVQAEIKSGIDEFINRFGDRCVGELKLETISYKQDPTLFIATLKSFVEQGVTEKSTSSDIDQQLRMAAEKEVQTALRGSPFKRGKFKRALAKTRYFVSNRENLRYERTRTFGMSREVFSALGRRFHENGVLENERDIFYLSKQEIFQYIEGTSISANLKILIKARKEEYQLYEQMAPPAERFTTYGSVYYQNDFYDTSMEEEIDGDLSGLGCCPGIIKARVRVVHHPSEIKSLDGDILVTSSTDPGWVTLFPTASAIIVERGSLLSHSAIVSREMGIPCIVGVTGLLRTLKSGDLIEMNGSTGQIKIINEEE